MDDEAHQAAQQLISPGGAWMTFLNHYSAQATERMTAAAMHGNPVGLSEAAEELRALGRISDAIAALVADAKVKATVAERRRRKL